MELEERLQLMEKTISELVVVNNELRTQLNNLQDDMLSMELLMCYVPPFCNNVLARLAEEFLYEYNKCYNRNFFTEYKDCDFEYFGMNKKENLARKHRIAGCINSIYTFAKEKNIYIPMKFNGYITQRIIDTLAVENYDNWLSIYNYTIFLKQNRLKDATGST